MSGPDEAAVSLSILICWALTGSAALFGVVGRFRNSRALAWSSVVVASVAVFLAKPWLSVLEPKPSDDVAAYWQGNWDALSLGVSAVFVVTVLWCLVPNKASP